MKKGTNGTKMTEGTDALFPVVPFQGRITSYGYPGDLTPDTNSANGIGAWDNRLGPDSLAVSRDVEAAFVKAGIRPMSRLLLIMEDGRELLKQWDDRTARSYKGKPLTGRYDFYCPTGRNPLEDQKVKAFRRLGP